MPLPEDQLAKGLEGREPKNTKLVPPGTPEPEVEQNEDQKILFGERDQEVSTATLVRSMNNRVYGSQIPVSTKTLRMLPSLRRSAEDPSLPPTVRDYYRTLVLGIEARLKTRG